MSSERLAWKCTEINESGRTYPRRLPSHREGWTVKWSDECTGHPEATLHDAQAGGLVAERPSPAISPVSHQPHDQPDATTKPGGQQRRYREQRGCLCGVDPAAQRGTAVLVWEVPPGRVPLLSTKRAGESVRQTSRIVGAPFLGISEHLVGSLQAWQHGRAHVTAARRHANTDCWGTTACRPSRVPPQLGFRV